jgi:type I restriction enzyme S subunit
MKNGMKQTEIGEIPVEWEAVKLESIAKKMQSGGTPKSTQDHYYGGEIPFVKIDDITSSGKYLKRTKTSISQEGLASCSAWVVPENSLLYSMYASLGFVSINKIPVATNQAIMNIVPISKVQLDFLYYCLIDLQDKIDKFISQTTQKNLNAQIVRGFLVPLPPLPEQRKIAEILSTLDEKMAVMDEQLAQTQELKKGLMQRLLTKGIGHTQFKNSPLGEIPASWEVVNQAEVATFYNGRAYKLTEWEKEGTPVIRLQNLTGSGKDYYYSNLELPKHQYCHSGDLLYMWSATFGPVWWRGGKAIFHYHIWKVEVDEKRLDRNYHYYLLDEVTARMKAQSHGSTMLHVTKGGMEKLHIMLPPLPEQRQIAEILTTVDEKIGVLQDKKAQYQTLKRGLMQQLLTGQRRVRVPALETAALV